MKELFKNASTFLLVSDFYVLRHSNCIPFHCRNTLLLVQLLDRKIAKAVVKSLVHSLGKLVITSLKYHTSMWLSST